MGIVCVILMICFLGIGQIRDVRAAICDKKWIKVLSEIGFTLFFVFFILSFSFGGSAYNDAATDHELYQSGHYYLISHGDYTEVSEAVYNVMKILEPIALVSFGISFAIVVIRDRDNKPKHEIKLGDYRLPLRRK